MNVPSSTRRRGVCRPASLSLTACNRGSARADTRLRRQADRHRAGRGQPAGRLLQPDQAVRRAPRPTGQGRHGAVVADAGGDSATQVSQIQDFITRQVSAIIYIPAGATAAGVPGEGRRTRQHPGRSTSTATRPTPRQDTSSPPTASPRQSSWATTSSSRPDGKGNVGDDAGPDRHHSAGRPREGFEQALRAPRA